MGSINLPEMFMPAVQVQHELYSIMSDTQVFHFTAFCNNTKTTNCFQC